MKHHIAAIRRELHELADESVRRSSQLFFKEPVNAYGVKAPMVKVIAKKILKELKKEDKKYIFEGCDELWRSGYMEESFIACEWAYSQRKKFEPGDFEIFEKWISAYVNNWASCDTFCNNSVGEFLLRYPAYVVRLKKWATAGNRWIRRASSVSLILPARQGKYLDDILEIASLQIKDEDDLVQKGYGWMLKVASKTHEKAVFDFIIKHKQGMPRTALRYAIEKMPAALKARAMAK